MRYVAGFTADRRSEAGDTQQNRDQLVFGSMSLAAVRLVGQLECITIHVALVVCCDADYTRPDARVIRAVGWSAALAVRTKLVPGGWRKFID